MCTIHSFTTAIFRALGANCPDLQELVLGRVVLTDQLSILELHRASHVTDTAVSILVRGGSQLQTPRLHVSFATGALLAATGGFHLLTHLWLTEEEDGQLSCSGMDALTQGCTKLEHLYLITPRVPVECAAVVRDRCGMLQCLILSSEVQKEVRAAWKSVLGTIVMFAPSPSGWY